MPVAQSDAVAFTIKELSGERREVRLTGRALPYRPLRFSGTQRVEADWPTGVTEGVLTVTGPSIEPTTINGMWKDRYIAQRGENGYVNPLQPALVDGGIVPDVRLLVETFDSIRIAGQELEVQWAHIIRRGVMSHFEHEWSNIHDVAWSCTFVWSNDGTTLGPAAFDQSSQSTDTTTALEQQRNQLVQAVEPPRTIAFNPAYIIALFDVVARINTSVQQSADNVAGLAIQANTPQDVARRTTAVCNGVIEQTAELIEELDAAPVREQVIGLDPSSPNPGVLLVAEKYVRGIRAQASKMRNTAIVSAATIGKALSPGLLATYMPKQGEDLRDVSRIFYGTSFEWRRLLQYNILDSSLCTVGQTILVPKLTNEVRQ